MRYALLFALGIALLAAGCTGSQPAPAAPATSCADYCPMLQHADCNGSWEISGSYPLCTCAFACATPPANQSQPPANQSTPPANVTPPAQNASAPANPPPPANVSTPALPVTTVSQLLNDALDSGRDEFYRNNDGSFRESTYTWLRAAAAAPPGEIQITAPATDVKFDGAAISSIAASGFTVFTDVSIDEAVAYGAAVFRARSTPLDNYSSTDLFIIDYVPGVIRGDLRDCRVYSREYAVDSAGGWLVSYLFRCGTVVPD